jgi:uncharacterized peroxidase-related enzyme
MSTAGFTMQVLNWEPHIPPVADEHLTPLQRNALVASGKMADKSAYFRVLVHDPGSLKHRSILYDHVMYSEGGLGRVERELAAFIVSRQNGCRYCVSVHARRLGQLAKNKSAVQEMLDGNPGLLADPRLKSIAEMAERLTSIPNGMTISDVRLLRSELGFTPVEYFDLINVIGMFAWANRLMQTLGSSVDSTVAVAEITVDPGRSTPASPNE